MNDLEMFDIWSIYFLGRLENKTDQDILFEIKEYSESSSLSRENYIKVLEQFAILGLSGITTAIYEKTNGVKIGNN